MAMLFDKVKNKTVFCLIIITLFTSFFFARSVVVREKWIVPTFLSSSPHQNGTAFILAFVNNWLKDGLFKLHFGTYTYPHSVETPTLDKRNFYASYPPGVALPVFGLFKFLNFTGIVSNIYEKRGIQLVMIILWNYLLHFLLTLVLCGIVFVVCRKIGFDNLNSTLLAIIPAIIQFHNSHSLYYHHLSYYHDIAVILPFVSYIFLELVRITHTSSRALHVVKIIQPLLMFWGVLTSWLFGFVILTIYVMRIVKKEIALPTSLQLALQWIKQSLIFFAPSLAAVAIWVWQIAHYLRHITHGDLLNTAVSGRGFTMLNNLLYRTGITDGVDYLLSYLKTSLYTHLHAAYGISGLLMLYTIFYIVIRRCKFMPSKGSNLSLLAIVYLMLFVPCLAYHLFFAQAFADHKFSSLMFSPALSVSFVFAPIFILQIMSKNYLVAAGYLVGRKSLTVVTVLGLGSSIVYGYSNIYNKKSVTKLFSPPTYHQVVIGHFIRKNTGYRDVIFSKDYFLKYKFSSIKTNFTNKLIHYADGLDHIYHKTKHIEQQFTVRILYYKQRRQEIKRLIDLLASQNIYAEDLQEEKIGGLLAFDGKEFLTWYEQVHECDVYPQHCDTKKSG